MGNRHGHGAASGIARGKGAVAGFHLEINGFADVLQPGIAQQNPRQQAGFGQDLKAVANAENIAATLGMGHDRATDRRIGGNRPAAQIIAKGKAPRHADDVDALGHIGVLVPDHADLGTGALEGHRQIAVAVRTGEGENSREFRC